MASEDNKYYLFVIGLIIVAIYTGFGITLTGIQNLCLAYITISTAILAITFAVCAIFQCRDNLREIFPPLEWLLAFSTLSLFGSILTYYVSYSIPYDSFIHLFFIGISILIFITIISFVRVIDRFNTRMKEQQPSVISPDIQTVAENPTCLPIIIEKCPTCGKIFSGQSDFCEVCGKQLTNIEKNNSHEFVSLFDSEITNLFTILAAVGAIISLLPAFSNFLMGPDWLPVLLSTELGFLSVILLILASYTGIIFILVILVCLIISSYSKIFNEKNKSSHQEKITAFVLIVIGSFSIFAAVLFLFFVWLAKADFTINYSILIFIIICEFLVILLISYLIISLAASHFFNLKLKKYPIKPAAVLLYVLIIAIVVFLAYPATADYVNNITKYYYSDKSIPVEIKIDEIDQNNITPASVHLNKTTDAYFGKNLSIFDLPYAQCHWSTNYGYFLTVTSNNSLIQRQSQEVISPGCGSYSDKLYWTYEINDFGKSKSPVLIGLMVEDRNKKVNNVLGDAHIILNWNSTDTVIIENNVTSFF